MKTALKIILPLLVLIAAAFTARTMIEARQEPEKEAPDIPPPLVRVLDVKPRNLRLTVRAEGTVTPRTETELVPEISGRTVWISPSLASGGFFEKDEILLKINPREYELAIVRARAAVAQAELRLATEEQEASLARKEWESLGEGEPTALTLRQPQIAEAAAAKAASEAALALAEYDLERTVVKAPYAGRVRQKNVDIGQFIARGVPMARIYAVDFAEVRLPIPDAELAYIRLPLSYRGESGRGRGPKVTLRATFAGREHAWQGRIVRTEAEIDPRTRMVHAIVQVADPYGAGGRRGRPPLAVGMFVRAEIQGLWVSNVVVLPRAVMRSGERFLIVDEQDRLRFREVEILRFEDDRVLVTAGLEAGDRVCVSALEAPVEGMKVRVARTENSSIGTSGAGESPGE